MSEVRKAVVLLSGGLDSATVLAMARAAGFACHALSFDYGQRHRVELAAAERVARQLGVVEHRVVGVDLRAIGGSVLTGAGEVPKGGDEGTPHSESGGTQERGGTQNQIPVTYVPARNLIFLSLAAGLAEVVGATDLFVGVNAVDYSGYPDCRPEFIRSFEQTVNLATKAGVEGQRFRVHTPLIAMSKAEIIREGTRLGVDYGLTTSCYDPVGDLACGRCESCTLRRRGFEQAGVADPTRYAAISRRP